jgi:hypothetical protein
MKTLNLLGALALAVAALALIWMEFGMLTAFGIAFSIAGYLFVLAMRKAAAEIMAYEQDQRPDLHVYDH